MGNKHLAEQHKPKGATSSMNTSGKHKTEANKGVPISASSNIPKTTAPLNCQVPPVTKATLEEHEESSEETALDVDDSDLDDGDSDEPIVVKNPKQKKWPGNGGAGKPEYSQRQKSVSSAKDSNDDFDGFDSSDEPLPLTLDLVILYNCGAKTMSMQMDGGWHGMQYEISSWIGCAPKELCVGYKLWKEPVRIPAHILKNNDDYRRFIQAISVLIKNAKKKHGSSNNAHIA
ncbi:hypothetical protein BOTBODRAFT_47688 [Botryobasidium botryosum FD-172 SS1]|uniref:Uncharacterized protein n=1 Tax=Botryobasidium botryosum (strain FD-172 SS1) TaxID=930990 RepID=A0A067M144_BOTB1|nr:hypothetical protein BOTBODRAFT_47688 [Botryobasidium botryosum FD-172 SS1]